jgi:hypothetical protein
VPDWRRGAPTGSALTLDNAEDVRGQVQAVIDTAGEFRTPGDLAAFVCR